jgi:hypothetical protein
MSALTAETSRLASVTLTRYSWAMPFVPKFSIVKLPSLSVSDPTRMISVGRNRKNAV